MKKIFIVVLIILLIVSVGFNIYFLINRETASNQSYLEGKYEGGRTYYNYSDDTEYVNNPEDSFLKTGTLGFYNTKNTLIFYKNGIMTYNDFKGTYTYSPKMKTVTFSFERNNYEETYTFEVSDDLKTISVTNKGSDTGMTNGEPNPYYIEEYILQ